MSIIGPLLTIIITTILFFTVFKIVIVYRKKNEQEEYLRKHGQPMTSQPPKKDPDKDLDDLLFTLTSENKTSGEVVNALLDKGYTMKDIHLAYDRYTLRNPTEKSKHKHL